MKTNYPKTVTELMVKLTAEAQIELGNTATAAEVEEFVRQKMSRNIQLPHPPERSSSLIAPKSGISYDFVKIPGGSAKGKFFLKPEMNEAEDFGTICDLICDATSATQGDVYAVTDALYRRAINILARGERFYLHPFGELTLTLKAEEIPDNYEGKAKEIEIKSVRLIPSPNFLYLLNSKARFTRRRIYADPILLAAYRVENILYALSIRPFLSIDHIATLNNVSVSTATRDIKKLINESKVYQLSDGRKNVFALYYES